MPSAAEVPAVPEVARSIFGDRLVLAERYANLLTGDGVVRGLIGPREAPRIWERHLLNCAVVADLANEGTRVVDVGSGAGLPGLVLAIRRPDLTVDLVEPLQRRVSFLTEAVDHLGLKSSVRVVRGRADDAEVQSLAGNSDLVTARAVAPLDRLVRWCLPLARPGGYLLAIKGEQAAAEVQQYRNDIRRAGGREVEIVECGRGLLDTPVMVVRIQRRP